MLYFILFIVVYNVLGQSKKIWNWYNKIILKKTWGICENNNNSSNVVAIFIGKDNQSLITYIK